MQLSEEYYSREFCIWIQYNTIPALHLRLRLGMPCHQPRLWDTCSMFHFNWILRVSSPFGTIVKLITNSSSSHVLKHFYHRIHAKCTLSSQVVAIYHIVSTCTCVKLQCVCCTNMYSMFLPLHMMWTSYYSCPLNQHSGVYVCTETA